MPDFLLKKEHPTPTLRLDRTGSALFFVSLGLFLLILAAYGGLWLLNRAQHQTILTLREQIQSKEEDARPELINQILALDQRLSNIRAILGKHVFLSNIFRLIEKGVHQEVRFSNFNLSANSRKIDLTGEAASYAALARQIALFEQDPQIERVEFGGLTLSGENLLGFKLTLTFKQALLQIRPNQEPVTSN